MQPLLLGQLARSLVHHHKHIITVHPSTSLCAQLSRWQHLWGPQDASYSTSVPPAQVEPLKVSSKAARRLVYGQPTHQTHPQLLSQGELTPGIQASEYKQRQARLCQLLPPGSVAILPSASTTYVSGVIPYPYRQDADFSYLTGLQQHGIAVLQTGATPDDMRYTLFIEAPDAQIERWNGASVNDQAAVDVFGADQAYHTNQVHIHLSKMCSQAKQVFFDVDRFNAHGYHDITAVLAYSMPHAKAKINSNAVQTLTAPSPSSLRPYLHGMRSVKSPAEVSLMRKSAQLSAHSIAQCMKASHPGVHEHWLAATFGEPYPAYILLVYDGDASQLLKMLLVCAQVHAEYECKRQGASRMAFPQVVAGGADATIVHYGRNDKVIPGHDMALMDAGCELHGYGSDVTRTWPVGGRYSAAQQAVYDIVLQAHQKCVAACRPGARLRDLHQMSVTEISQGIKDLGLCKGATASQIQGGLYRDFYWHSVGHWLGLDIHDTHLIGHDRPLQPGHVITIEPGLYIADESRFGAVRGIGVRIEDDVLVTEQGCEVLSSDVPHLPEQVEALVGSAAAAAAAR